MLSFLGRIISKKDLQFVKLAHDFKNMPKAKFQNQWSFRICYYARNIYHKHFAVSNHYFCEYKITSIDVPDGPSIRPCLYKH